MENLETETIIVDIEEPAEFIFSHTQARSSDRSYLCVFKFNLNIAPLILLLVPIHITHPIQE